MRDTLAARSGTLCCEVDLTYSVYMYVDVRTLVLKYLVLVRGTHS